MAAMLGSKPMDNTDRATVNRLMESPAADEPDAGTGISKA